MFLLSAVGFRSGALANRLPCSVAKTTAHFSGRVSSTSRWNWKRQSVSKLVTSFSHTWTNRRWWCCCDVSRWMLNQVSCLIHQPVDKLGKCLPIWRRLTNVSHLNQGSHYIFFSTFRLCFSAHFVSRISCRKLKFRLKNWACDPI